MESIHAEKKIEVITRRGKNKEGPRRGRKNGEERANSLPGYQRKAAQRHQYVPFKASSLTYSFSQEFILKHHHHQEEAYIKKIHT